MRELTIGTMYKSTRDGFVEYKGIDRFCGETTMMFKMGDGRIRYVDPAEVEEGYLVGSESPEVAELKAQLTAVTAQFALAAQRCDELLSAVEKAFVELEKLDASGDVGGWIFDEVELLRAAIAKAKAKGGAA